MTPRKAARNLASQVYRYRFAGDFMVIYPYFMIMLTDRGMSTLQVSALLAIWSLVPVLLEIPTGALADRWPCQKLLAIGEVIRAFGYATWLCYPHFWGFFAGFACWGAKNALTSGTLEALMYIGLDNPKHDYLRSSGRTEFASLSAVVLASAAAIPVFRVGYTGILGASIGLGLLAAGLAWRLPAAPPGPVNSPRERKPYLSLISAGLRTAMQDRAVRPTLIMAAGVGVLPALVYNFGPLYLADMGWSKSNIPWIFGVITLGMGLVGFVIPRLEFWPTRTTQVVFLGILGFIPGSTRSGPQLPGFLLVSAIVLQTQWLLAPIAGGFRTGAIDLGAYCVLMKCWALVWDARLQHCLADNARATVTSVKGFLNEAGIVVGYLVMGLLSRAFGPYNALFLISVILMVSWLIVLTTYGLPQALKRAST